MSSTELGTSLATIHRRRRFILELIASAVVLGFLINAFTTCLFCYLDPQCANPTYWSTSAAICGLILLVFTVAIGSYLLSRKETEESGLSMMLGFDVDQSACTVAIIGPSDYPPVRHAQTLFAAVKGEMEHPFAKGWRGPKPIDDPDFRPGDYCWEAIVELLEAIIVLLLQRYGKETLTYSAHLKGEFRRLAGRLEPRRMDRSDPHWNALLERNRFLRRRGIEKLYLPPNAWITTDYPQPRYGEIAGRRDLIVITQCGSLTFSISPNWTLLGKRARALSGLSLPDPKRVCLLYIPIEVRLEVGGFLSLSPTADQKADYHYRWFQKLIDNARRRMNWGVYVREKGSSHDG